MLSPEKIELRKKVYDYFIKVAHEDNAKNNKQSFESLINKEDSRKRILFVMPESIGDIYMTTSLLPSIKKVYPDYALYYATKPQFFEILDGNSFVDYVIPYCDIMNNIVAMEGQGNNQGFFDICFLPNIGTQRILNYMHNGEDKIQLNLCTS